MIDSVIKEKLVRLGLQRDTNVDVSLRTEWSGYSSWGMTGCRNRYKSSHVQRLHVLTYIGYMGMCRLEGWLFQKRSLDMGPLFIKEIRLSPEGPKFAKRHPKQESTWYKQYKNTPTADLRAYPSSDKMLQSWKKEKKKPIGCVNMWASLWKTTPAIGSTIHWMTPAIGFLVICT